MDPDEDPNLALDIPVRGISEELCCPICFNYITQCVITPCGHNFCSACISECLNMKHKCPCCNKSMVKDDLIRNHHFDKFVEIISLEKEKASKKYFEKLISSSNPSALTHSQQEMEVSTFSPIEQLFHKHMKRSLMNYEEYYKEIESKYQSQCSEVSTKYTKLLSENSSSLERKLRRIAKGASERKEEDVKKRNHSKSQKLQKECNQKLGQLKESFDESVNMLLRIYEEYLEKCAPAKEFLPVVLSVLLPEKNITIQNVSISRTDSLCEVKEIVERRLAENGQPLASWSSSILFTLLDKVDESKSRVIDDPNLPVVQFGAQQGSLLAITGSLLLESDKPKECFTASFEAGVSQTDYFSCKDCNINWVCAECASICHKGHNIVDYMKNHKPTWNCCYCVKKKKCTIPNKVTKKKEGT